MFTAALAFLRHSTEQEGSVTAALAAPREAVRPVPSEDEVPGGDGSARTALVYIPGLDRHWFNRDPKLISEQVAVALDRFHAAPERFDVGPLVPTVHYGAGEAFSTPVHTIRRVTKAEPQPVADVYILDYHPTLTSAWEKTNVAVQAVLVLVRVVTGFARLGGALLRKAGQRGKAKSVGHILQTGFLMGILLLLSLYLALLLTTLGASVAEVIRQFADDSEPVGTGPAPLPTFTWPDAPDGWDVPARLGPAERVGGWVTEGARSVWEGVDWVGRALWRLMVFLGAYVMVAWERGSRVWTMLALLGAAALVFVRNSQDMIRNTATTFVCAYNYLSDGGQRDAIGGQLSSLLQHLAEQPRTYTDVHILAYSFGSVVALDTLFPHDERPSSGFDEVGSLTTVGCPFDLIRTYFPAYFEHRTRLADDIPKSWVNVYCPHDVLGSNFRDTMSPGPAEVGPCGLDAPATGEEGVQEPVAKPVNAVFHGGVGPEQRSVLSLVTLYGLRAHGLYWAKDANAYDALMLALPEPLRSIGSS